ncbi:APC family permease [Novosphingobium taihuense]|uniref:Amino acid transporter n=1 Tax=Novosphingobium taihuense TaxID=260085 RepID=A0A7W7ABW4_9SPHN|nr:APC family permease [Novosphingobium taihuense]MBB4614173.1 amino acid transporter [Novosphingobium taihuense]TWH87023.1 amino acid/polyamine/organocation transporter, APC superfamily (TC 2.A.3) [Novosphingobium taihuense]
MTRDPHRTGDTVSGHPALRRVFGTGSLVMFGLAYLVPLTVFTTFGSVSKLTQGHLPLAYVLTSIAMLFTAASYARLVRIVPAAGSAFSYAGAAFGRRVGFITGWTLLLDYILLPAINYLILGIYLGAQFPSVLAPVWSLGAIALVTVLNIIGVDVVRRASMALVAIQLVFAAVFLFATFTSASVVPVADPFMADAGSWSGVVAGAAVLCLSFLGFDAVSTLSEEARDPARTVPRAILMTTLIGGAIFVALAYAGTSLLPDWRMITASDSAGLEVMRPLGGFMSAFFLAAYVSGCLASALAAQASVARVLYAMGRENVLPRSVFGQLSARFHTPVRATMVVAALSALALLLTLDTLASLISFGALFAFSLVNLAVVRLDAMSHKARPRLQVAAMALCPALGFLATLWLWFNLSALALIVGIAWLVAGLVYGFIRQDVADRVGEALG